MIKNSINLSTQIKRAIGSRLLICFILAIFGVFTITLNDIISSSHQLKNDLKEQSAALGNFAVSQALTQNEEAIQPKLDELNNKFKGIKYIWSKRTKLSEKLDWNFPLSWTYYCPVNYLDGTPLGTLIASGSLLSDHDIFPDLIIQIASLFLLFSIIFILLYPLSRKIPQKLFVAPINNLLLLLKEGENEVNLKEPSAMPQEINEIRDKIIILLKYAEERSRQVTITKMSRQVAIGEMATQVAHDIRSPLAALDMAIKNMQKLSESERILFREAIQRIHDITNNLLTHYQNKDISTINHSNITAECIELLISSLISEKRAQYLERPIQWQFDIAEEAHGAFCQINTIEFKRALSNLLNNAIEAISQAGVITLNLMKQEEKLILILKDTGRGIPSEVLPKIIEGGVSLGKANGSGLGLSSSIKLIESWGGKLEISSIVNQGTTIKISLPIAPPPSWFSDKLNLLSNSSIIILDDDESIHHIWEQRFKENHLADQNIKIYHFRNPHEVINWYNNHYTDSTIFLLDYELIGQSISGIDVVESCKIASKAYLVTSRYEDKEIRERCDKLRLKIIPKSFSVYIPITVIDTDSSSSSSQTDNLEQQELELVFIDNDIGLTTAWQMSAEIRGKKIKTFNRVEDLMAQLENYPKTLAFYIDCALGQDISGEDLAKQLYEKGYTNLYLATGYPKYKFAHVHWVKDIVGKTPPFMK